MSTLKLSSRLANVKVSATVAIADRAKQLKAEGRDIIALASGEPDFDTPLNIRAAAHRALDSGETHYTMAEGIVELRQAVCNKLKRDSGLHYAPDQVIVSAGGKQVIFNAMMATLERGDEVIIPAPYWVSYPDIVRLFGGKPVIVQTEESSGFLMSPSQLESAISENTRWVFLNSPSNPSGAVYQPSDLQAIGEVLMKHPQVWVMTDDIYEKIVYDDIDIASFAEAVPSMQPRTLVVNGLSKSHAMTGWRLGYGASSVELTAAMRKIQGQSTMHPCSIAQWAGVEALNGPQEFLAGMLESFSKRRDQTMAALDAIDGIHCFPPQGAFYLFISVKDQLNKSSAAGTRLLSDADWVMALMEEQGVSVVPGSAFGTEGYFRLSFATDEKSLEVACKRIAQFCEGVN